EYARLGRGPGFLAAASGRLAPGPPRPVEAQGDRTAGRLRRGPAAARAFGWTEARGPIAFPSDQERPDGRAFPDPRSALRPDRRCLRRGLERPTRAIRRRAGDRFVPQLLASAHGNARRELG